MAHSNFDTLIEEHGKDWDLAGEALETLVTGAARGTVPIESAPPAIDSVAADLRSRSAEFADVTIPTSYLDGAAETILNLRHSATPADIARRGDFEILNGLLRDGLLEDLAGATDQITRDAKREIREITRRNLETITAGVGEDLEVAALDMEMELAQRGIAFTDRGGRRWQPGTYARMVLRTKLAETLNTGALVTAAQLGASYVRVSDGHGTDTDEPCIEADGQVWHIAYALAHKIEHPNCRRSFTPMAASYAGRIDREAA